MSEYDRLGRDGFLGLHGFGPSRRYVLIHDGRPYDSKAIAGVAYRYATGEAIGPHDFSGGRTGAAKVLANAGFDIRVAGQPSTLKQYAESEAALKTSRLSDNVASQGAPDVLLVGCVKKKRATPARARDLYVSPLWAKRRLYAERMYAAHQTPWFILSAEHALVDPDQVLPPYDLHLARTPIAHRRAWGEQAIDQLADALGSLDGAVVEVHAGAAYVDAIREPLTRRGAILSTPLQGLQQGRQLAWYNDAAATWVGTSVVPTHSQQDDPLRLRAESNAAGHSETGSIQSSVSTGVPSQSLNRLMGALTDRASAVPAYAFAASEHKRRLPGLYAWFTDATAEDVIRRQLHVAPTAPVYVGQAGATSTHAGKISDATLASRIGGNHLGGQVTGSTFARTWAALLLEDLSLRINEHGRLTADSRELLAAWMGQHLFVVTVPIPDRGQIGQLEESVLAHLNPTLNLSHVPNSPPRARLRALRRTLRS
jgi:hypothetical protein